MAARLWTALLVLLGVLVMHGAQCTAAADDVGHPSPAAHSTVLAPTGTLVHGAPVGAIVVAATGITPVGTVLAGTAPAAIAAAGGPSSDSHGTAGHLWTVCLAVLATALAVLQALLLPHPAFLARLALPRGQARLRSLSPLRPPDLSELCLLRI